MTIKHFFGVIYSLSNLVLCFVYFNKCITIQEQLTPFQMKNFWDFYIYQNEYSIVTQVGASNSLLNRNEMGYFDTETLYDSYGSFDNKTQNSNTNKFVEYSDWTLMKYSAIGIFHQLHRSTKGINLDAKCSRVSCAYIILRGFDIILNCWHGAIKWI